MVSPIGAVCGYQANGGTAENHSAMITGVHAIFYTKRTAAMYGFLKDTLGLSFVDAGNGRLFFSAPPTELAVHATEDEPEHELWLVCDDVAATVRQLEAQGVKTTPIADRGWGLTTLLELPGGDKLGLYERKHLSPLA